MLILIKSYTEIENEYISFYIKILILCFSDTVSTVNTVEQAQDLAAYDIGAAAIMRNMFNSP